MPRHWTGATHIRQSSRKLMYIRYANHFNVELTWVQIENLRVYSIHHNQRQSKSHRVRKKAALKIWRWLADAQSNLANHAPSYAQKWVERQIRLVQGNLSKSIQDL